MNDRSEAVSAIDTELSCKDLCIELGLESGKLSSVLTPLGGLLLVLHAGAARDPAVDVSTYLTTKLSLRRKYFIILSQDTFIPT